MKIIFAGNKERGLACLDALLTDGRHEIVAIVAAAAKENLRAKATSKSIPFVSPEDINVSAADLSRFGADLMVLAGYGPIITRSIIDLFPRGVINTLAGKLPECRGSSPMNWALIRGHHEFSLSIIQVDDGVDTGDVLSERTFPIGPDDTIADLHRIANKAFPDMLLEVVDTMERGMLEHRRQSDDGAGYFPLRFPGDGLIVWDLMTAEEVHNRIRALTDPYPGAYSFMAFKGNRRITLLESSMTRRAFFGEPGRVYLINPKGLLTCARDRCLWIRKLRFEDGSDAAGVIRRYDQFATVRGGLERFCLSEA